MALLIRKDGSATTVSPANKRRGFTLDECYKAIGDGCGTVQQVNINHGVYCYMIVDEEGKLRQGWTQRINKEATRIYNQTYGADADIIVGNVLLCTEKEWK